MSESTYAENGTLWRDAKNNLWEDALQYHFWEGIENKFPLCCIIYFCDFFLKNNTMNWCSEEDFHKVDYENKWVGYIQCPQCMIK